jgi:hypothetical protein
MYIRIPIISALRKSPFEGLTEHAGKIKECIRIWKLAVTCYAEKKYGEFGKLSEKVKELEHEADLIKGNINAHLPKGIRMPVYKSDFMLCLKEQDSILDYAEDTVVWLGFKTVDLDSIKDELLELLQKVTETVETLEKVALEIQPFFAKWKAKQRKNMKELLMQVHRQEWESDRLEKKLTKKIFNSNFSAVDVFYITTLIKFIADIANHAENAGDKIRAMIAK